MTLIIAMYLLFTSPPTDAEVQAFQSTALSYLSLNSAYWHLLAARAAGMAYNIRPELLLAIAHHESNYNVATRTPEPGHRVSCGVMTPVPQSRCSTAELTLYAGYDAGARHLRLWLDHCENDEICALLCYAGGGGLYRACKLQGHWRTARGTDACDIPYQFRRRSAQIRRALTRNVQM